MAMFKIADSEPWGRGIHAGGNNSAVHFSDLLIYIKIVRGFFCQPVYNDNEGAEGKGGGDVKEQEMIELLRSKDETGMHELLVHCGPLMRYVIAPILPNPQDQEDCLSEAAMQVWKNIGQFNPRRGSWNAWLTAVARNHALNYRRGAQAHPSIEELSSDIPSPGLNPEEEMLRQERKAAVNGALRRLSVKDRTLFFRKYYYLQSTAQIASEMGMTERAVEGKLYRIKKQLRKLLGGEEYAGF